MSSSASSSSPELQRLLGVRQLGWAELAALLERAEQAEEGSDLAGWLSGLQDQRFEPVFAYLSTHATGRISRLAGRQQLGQAGGSSSSSGTVEQMHEFRDRWSRLRIFRDAATGEYRSFRPDLLAVLRSDDAELCRVLRLSGVAVLAEGATEAERQLHSALGLLPATAKVVATELLLTSATTITEQQAAAVARDTYWGRLRILAHLLETRAVASGAHELRQVWLLCRGNQGRGAETWRRANEVSLPSVLGHALSSEACEPTHFLAVTPPPPEAGQSSAWEGCSSLDFEALLARLGCHLPSWEGRVEVDLSRLWGCGDVMDLLEAGFYSRVRDHVLVPTTQQGQLVPPTQAFVPHVVLLGDDDDALPIVRLDPAVPPSACRPGEPLHVAMRQLGVRRAAHPLYFLRSIRRVAEAESAVELEGLAAVHGVAVAVHGEGGGLPRLKLSLVHKLLGSLREADPEEVRRAGERLRPSVLRLPAGGEGGVSQLVSVDRLFLLDVLQELDLPEPVGRGLGVAVQVLEGARAMSGDNMLYLQHRAVLTALGAPTAFEASHVIEALALLLASSSSPGQEQEQEEGDGEGASVAQQRGKALVLYRCLDHMLGQLADDEEEDLPALLQDVRLLTQRGTFLPAPACARPIVDPFKQQLSHVKGGRELPCVSPALLGLERLLSCCPSGEERWGGQVACDIPQRVRGEFVYAHALSDAVSDELRRAGGPRLQVVLAGEFLLRHQDVLEAAARKGLCLQPEYALLQGHVLADGDGQGGDGPGLQVMVAAGEGPDGAAPRDVVALLRVKLTDHGKHSSAGDLSTAFTQRLHAALTTLLQSQRLAATAGQARESAVAMVQAVFSRLPGALMPESVTDLALQSRLVPYGALLLPPPDEQLRHYLSLPWRRPGSWATTRPEGEDGNNNKGDELTRAQYERVQERGAQAEEYAHRFFSREVEGYSAERCWVSESKARVVAADAMGEVDEAAGYDFRLKVAGRRVLVEVKASCGGTADARVLMSQNQLDRMREVQRCEAATDDAYLVMVVGHVGRPGQEEHRFFTPAQVQEEKATQHLCQVVGDGHGDLVAALRGSPEAEDRHPSRQQPQRVEDRAAGARGQDYGAGHHDHHEHQAGREREGAGVRGPGRYEAPHDHQRSYGPAHDSRGWRGRDGHANGSGDHRAQRYDRDRHDDAHGAQRSDRRPRSESSDSWSSGGGGGRALSGYSSSRRSSYYGDRDGGHERETARRDAALHEGGVERRQDKRCMRGCNNGSGCRFWLEGRCKYLHPQEPCPGCGRPGGH